MAVEGLRRSTRARTQVRSYADEQAEQTASTAPRKRKQLSASRLDDTSDGFEEEHANLGIDSEEDRPIKKQKRSSKQSSKKPDNGMQPYGAPPEGTMIPWIKGRMCRQPKVWELPKKKKKVDKVIWHAEAAEKRIAARLHDVERLEEGEEEHRLLDQIYDEDDLSEKYLSALDKANKEKMFVLDRVRDVHDDCHTNLADCPCETLTVAGSKGNVYTVTISHLMTCNCPVAIYQKKGQETPCKHSIYVLHKILRAPEHLKYQQAFLTQELKELFAHAPRLPSEIAEQTVKDGNRKAATGDCPICFEDLEEGEELTWCRAACGNNLHVACFQQWERAKNPVTCPYCRAHWQTEDAGKAKQKTMVTKVNLSTAATGVGGYANVKDQLDY